MNTRDLPVTADSIRAEASADLRLDIARRTAALVWAYPSVSRDVVLNIAGYECELNARIYFEHTPEERRTWDHPGVPAYVEIRSVMVGGVDMLKALPDEFVDDLAGDILEAL